MKINRKAVYLLLLTLISRANASSTIVPSRDEVARERYWGLLLHMRGARSEARGFFFSPRGDRDPKAELDATLEAFASDSTTGFFAQHPQCAYPERYRYLKERLQLKLRDIACPELQQWKSGFRARSVSLLYAAPYLGQAASMFGHTFLRVNSAGNELLDQGISFEAAVGPTPNPLYIFKGLFGGFAGLFSQTAFYQKIKSYSHLENRDLWSYELNLNEGEIEHLLNHVWELQNAHFPYYFTNGNCAYHLLSLLEVARPDWNLRSQFYFKAVPLDAVRVVTQQPGTVRAVHGRPALMRLFKSRLDNFAADQKKRFFDLREKPETVTENEDPQILDAVLDWRLLQQKPMDSGLLKVRARSPATPLPTVELGSAPDSGHSSSKLMFTAGARNGQSVMGLEARPVLHDLLDADLGYIPFSQLLAGEVAIDYLPERGTIALNRFVLGEVVNLQPGVSWLLGARLHRPEEQQCFDCLAGQIQGGLGSGVTSFAERVLFYGLAKTQGEISNRFEHGRRGGLALELAALAQITDRLKARVAAEKFIYRDNEYSKFLLGASWSQTTMQWRAEVETLTLRQSHPTHWRLGLAFYY